MLLQDLTVEHTHPEVIALAVRQAVDWGALVEGYFICPTPPVVPRDDLPSHTLVHYRRHDGEPAFDPPAPPTGHISAVGACQCLDRPPEHQRYQTGEELAAAVLEVLRGADPSCFPRARAESGRSAARTPGSKSASGSTTAPGMRAGSGSRFVTSTWASEW